MLKQVYGLTGITIAATIGFIGIPQSDAQQIQLAQMTEQEFQMGRVREACRTQAEQHVP